MTNLVEILKNAPKGLELYSPVGGKVKLYSVKPSDMYPIVVENSIKNVFSFDKYGRINEYGECCLFPSKEQREWNNWYITLLKPGMFIKFKDSGYTDYIMESPKDGYCRCISMPNCVITNVNVRNYEYPYSFASTEEIEHFYVELRKKGFTIKNGELKLAEKCKIRLEGYPTNVSISVNETKITTITDSKPFTIGDFKPFDKVLVKAIFGWKIELFAIYHKGWDTPYECLGGSYDKCVPYNEETKCLLSTFIEYNGKYKTW